MPRSTRAAGRGWKLALAGFLCLLISAAPSDAILTPRTPLPAPVVTQVVPSRALKRVLVHGLAIHYTVNEQVAGEFQLLLDTRTAHRLKVAGPLATGLPKGFARSIVIGSALLVTTRGGRGWARIRLSKPTAAHLSHLHRLELVLRVIARNASSQNPLTTTRLSTVVLKG